MNLNLIALLDSLLEDWASPKVRRLIHALLALALFVITAVLAAGGDWKAALGTLAVTVYAAMNKANTPPTPTPVLLEDEDENEAVYPTVEEVYVDTENEAADQPIYKSHGGWGGKGPVG